MPSWAGTTGENSRAPGALAVVTVNREDSRQRSNGSLTRSADDAPRSGGRAVVQVTGDAMLVGHPGKTGRFLLGGASVETHSPTNYHMIVIISNRHDGP